MSDDLVRQLRASLPGIAQEECGGDNLAILLASFFEPGIESDELDDSGTWKQGAIDACNRVLDAIHAHYTQALTEARAEIERLNAQVDEALRSCLAEREGRLKAETAISTLRARVREVVGPFASTDLLECKDCVDNDGKHYQSQWLADALRAARQLNEDLTGKQVERDNP